MSLRSLYPWRKVGDDLFCSTECFHFFSHKNYIASLEKKIKELEAKQAPAPKPEPKKCEKCDVATSNQYGGFIGAVTGDFFCADCYILHEKSNQCAKCKKTCVSGFTTKTAGMFYCSDCYCVVEKPDFDRRFCAQPCLKCKKTDIGGVTSKSGDGFYCNNCFFVIDKTDYDPRFRAVDAKQCLNCKLPKPNYFIGSGSGRKYCCDCFDLKPKTKTPETVTPAAGYYNPDTHVIVPRKELQKSSNPHIFYVCKDVIASQLHDDKPAACPLESSGCDSTPAQKPQNHGCYSGCYYCNKRARQACPP